MPILWRELCLRLLLPSLDLTRLDSRLENPQDCNVVLPSCNGVESERVTGSGTIKGMPVLRAARQRRSSRELGAVTKGTPLGTVLSHPIPSPPRQPELEKAVPFARCFCRSQV
eukprot:360667-Chlamydomonas_euryale.AAC.14